MHKPLPNCRLGRSRNSHYAETQTPKMHRAVGNSTSFCCQGKNAMTDCQPDFLRMNMARNALVPTRKLAEVASVVESFSQERIFNTSSRRLSYFEQYRLHAYRRLAIMVVINTQTVFLLRPRMLLAFLWVNFQGHDLGCPVLRSTTPLQWNIIVLL